jgi:hypothetical protein
VIPQTHRQCVPQCASLRRTTTRPRVLTNKNYKKTGFAVFLSVVLSSPIRMWQRRTKFLGRNNSLFNTCNIYIYTNNQGWRQRQHKLHSCLIQSLSDEINCTAVEILFLSSSTQTFFKKMNPNLFDVALLKATNNTFPNVLSVRFSISYIHRIIVEPSSINHLIGAVYGVLLCITLTWWTLTKLI